MKLVNKLLRVKKAVYFDQFIDGRWVLMRDSTKLRPGYYTRLAYRIEEQLSLLDKF